MAATPDYAILSPPRISAAGFAAVLRGGSSPAAAEADACYRAFVAAGVDPAVGLAIFRKESTYGRFGRANRNRSWGNIRGGSTYPLDDGRFRIYPSWTAGAADAARLLVVYGTNRIRPGTKTSTVQTLPYVWAPSSDGNAPDAYGDSLARWIGEWAAKYPSSGGANADLVGEAVRFEDLIPPDLLALAKTDPAAAVAKFKAALVAAGISTDDSHRLTQDEADRLAVALKWPKASQLATSIVGLIYQSLGLPNSFNPGFTLQANQNVADAVAGIPAAIGAVLTQVAVLAGLLLIVLLGLYLIATSDQ